MQEFFILVVNSGLLCLLIHLEKMGLNVLCWVNLTMT